MAKTVRSILLLIALSVLAGVPGALADTINPNSPPVSVFVTPGPQTGGVANGSPVSVFVTPGPQTGGVANGSPVSVFVTPGPQTGGVANGSPVSVFVTPGPQTGGYANSRPVSAYVLQLKDVLPGLVGYWPMDGDWYDHSGSNYHGTQYNGATFSTNSKGGTQAGSFNGTNQYIKVSLSALVATTSSSTIEAWVYPTSFNPQSSAIYSENNTGGVVFYLSLSTAGTVWQGVWRSDVTGNWKSASTSAALPLNAWSHVAVTLDSTGTKIYINGSLAATNPSNKPSNATVAEVDIGRFSNGGGQSYFPGLIDELAVFNRALSSDEVMAHYLNGIIPGLHAPVINPVTSPAATPNIVFSGTRDLNTSIWINGSQAVAADSTVNWQAAYTLNEGLNTLKFSEHDASQNVSPEVVVNVLLDTIPPAAGTVTINNGAAYTNLAAVSLKLNPTDSGSGVSSMQFSNDGVNWSDWETYAASKTWTVPTGDGLKTVSARFKDAAGNISAAVSASITLDTVAPAIPVLTSFTALTGQTSQTISGTRSEEAKTVSVYVNGTAVQASSVSYPSSTSWSALISGLIPGDNSVTVKGKDEAGNESGLSQPVHIKVDKIPPVWDSLTGVRFVEPGAGSIAVRWNSAHDAEGAAVGYNVYVDDTKPMDYTKARKATVQDIGTVTEYYSAENDYSPVMGRGGWYYYYYDGTSYRNMTFDGSTSNWKGVNTYLLLWNNGGHPDGGNDSVRAWKAPADGNAHITGKAYDANTGCGDGVVVSIRHNGTKLWEKTISNGDTTGYTFDLSLDVLKGEYVYFHISQKGDPNCDSTYFNPSVAFSSAGVQGLGKGYDYGYTCSGLDDNKNYYIAVRAVDGFGNEESNTVTMKALPQTGAGAKVAYRAEDWSGGEEQGVVVTQDGYLTLAPGATSGTYTSQQLGLGTGNSASTIAFNYAADAPAGQSVAAEVFDGQAWTTVMDGQQDGLPDADSLKYRISLAGDGSSSPMVKSLSIAYNDSGLPATPVVNQAVSPTSASAAMIAGTKETMTSVWLNGVEVVPVSEATSWQYTATLPNEGVNSFTVLVKDTAGNQSPTSSFSIVRDTTPPVVSATTPASGSLNTSVAAVTVSFGDAGSSPDLAASVSGAVLKTGAAQVDGTWSYGSGSATFTPNPSLPDGSYTLTIYPVDILGNKAASPTTLTFTVDSTPPTAQLSTSLPSPFKATAVTFTLTFSENMNTAVKPGATFGSAAPYDAFALPAGSWLDAKRYSATYTFGQSVPDGNYTIKVSEAKDLAGNVMLEAQAGSFVLDETPPAVPSVGSVTTPTKLVNLDVGGTKEPGSAIVINGKVVAPIDGNGTWSSRYLLIEGTNTLNIIARDAAGNDSAPVTPAPVVVLDTTPPDFTVNYTTPATKTTQTLNGQKEPGCVLKVNGTLIAGANDASPTWSYEVTLTDGITNNLVFTASDSLGNTKTKTISILCDTNPPATLGPGVLEAFGSGSGSTVTLTWSGYNESLVPDLAYYKVYVSSAPITDISGLAPVGTTNKGQRTYTAASLTTGTVYYFAVVPVDQSGNFRTAVNGASAIPTDTQAPEDVTNLKALCAYDKGAGTNSVTITWTASLNSKGDLASQKVYFDGGSGYDSGTALTKDALTYTKAGVADNTHVKLKVTEIDRSGNESSGRVVEATTRIPNPTGVSTSPLSGSITISWSPVASPYLKQYNVYQLNNSQQQSDISSMTLAKSTTATSATITGLTNGVTYQFAVASVNTSDAENATVTSVAGTPRSDSTGPVIGTFTVALGSAVITDGSPVTQPAVVNITATDAESQMAKVELYVDGGLVKTQTGGSLSYNWDIVLTTDGNHVLRAVAYDAPGNQSELQKTCIVNLGVPPAPVITGHTISGSTPQTANISGTAAADTAVVLISGGVVIGSATTQNGQFQFTGVALEEGANEFYAKASHRGGDSPLSAKYSIMVDTAAPEAPAGLAVKAATGGVLKFTWSAGPGGTPAGYNLYYSSSSFSAKTQAGVTKGNSSVIKYGLTDFVPPDDGMRYYVVTALDAAGNESGISNVVTVSSDRVAPYLTSRAYKYTDTKGGVTEQATVAGPGRVEVSIAVNEPLSETPFFSITPASGMPIVVALAKVDDTNWKGEFAVNSLASHGKTQYQFTGKDMVGNRGTASGDGIFIDLQGPVATITDPVSFLKLADQPVSVKVQFDEQPVGLPSLELVDGAGATVHVDNLADTGDGLHFTGSVNVSMLAEGEAKFNLTSAIDKFGNNSDIVSSGKSIILYKDHPPAPPVPTGLTAKAEKGGKVTLTWNPVGGAVAYRLYRRADGESTPATAQTGLTATTTSDVPDVDSKYYYSVSSVGQLSSESARSTEADAVSDRTPPNAPAGLTLAFGANGVTAAWSAPQGEAPASYNLYRAGSCITTDLVKSLVPVLQGVNALSASDPSPASSLRYYAITAVDALGNEGSPSESKDITFPVAPVRNLILIRMDDTAPVLTWEAPQPGVSYNIYRDGTKLTASPVAQTAYTDSSYSGGTVKYGISAVDTYGNESPVKEVSYSGFDAGIASGVVLNRGYIQKLPMLLNNPGDSDVSVDSINLQVGGGAQSTLVGPFVVGAKSSLQVEKIGATGLDTPSPAAVSVMAQWSPSPGVTVLLSTTRSAEVTGAGATMELFSEPLIRGAEAKVKLKVYNRGDADMDFVTSENDGPSSQVKVCLKDQDGNLLAQGSLNQRADAAGKIINGSGYAVARIAPGDSFLTDEIRFTVPVTAPYGVNLEAAITNTYYHYKKPEQVVASGVRQVTPSTISEAAYRASATVAQNFYSGAQPVVITGQAISNTTNAPMPQVPVVIGVSLRGFDRYYTVNSDAQGNFSYTFQPGVTEAGIYSVWANHPDVKNRSIQATFTIAGMEMSPATATVKILKGGYWDIPLTLKNPGDAPLNGVTYAITASSGVSAVVMNNDSTAIDPGKIVYRTLRVSLSQGAPDVSQVTLDVTTAQGLKARLDATVIGVTSIPIISASPSVIDTGIVRGDQRVITINLTNTGAGTLLNARVEGPALPWITLATDPAIGDVAPGANATVAVLLKPNAAVAQKAYDDAIVISSDNHIPFRIPIQCTVVTDSVGSISFDVLNSLNQKVIGATARIQNAALYELSYTKSTDTAGVALFADVPAGSYVYTVSAPNCKPYSGSFEVVPGVVGFVPVGLEVNLVSVDFTVTPVTIGDTYQISVTQTFQTNVPVPVLVIDPPSTTLPEMASGEIYNGEFNVTNYGLISADSVGVAFPKDFGDYTIELLGSIPRTIAAKQTITVPFRVIKR